MDFLQRLCGLDWESSKLADNMVFLDLFCWIDRDKKLPNWKSWAKPESLFLQIPPNSAHAGKA